MNKVLLVAIVAVVVIGGSVAGVTAYRYATSRSMRILNLTSSMDPYEVMNNQSESILPPSIPQFNISVYASSASFLRLFVTSPSGSTLELYNEPTIGYENITEPTASISLALATYSFFSEPGNFIVTAELFKNATVVEKNITETVKPPLTTYISGPRLISGNEIVNYRVEITGGVPPYSIKWSDISPSLYYSNSSSISENASFPINESGNWTVNALVTDDINFTSLASVSVIDYTSPTISAVYDPVDVGVNDNFTINTYGNNQGFTCKWELYPQDKYLGDSKSIGYSFLTTGKYLLKVTLTNSSGNLINVSLNVTVNSPPVINAHLEYSQTDMGVSDAVNFTVTGGVPFLGISYNYSIFIGNQTVSTGYAYTNTTNFAFFSAPYEQGTFTVSVEISDKCHYTVIENMTLIVNPSLQVPISEQGNITLNGTFTLISNLHSGTGPFNFSWTILTPNGPAIITCGENTTTT